MQSSTSQTTGQNSDTAKALLQQLQKRVQQVVAEHPELGPVDLPSTDPSLQFTWPAKLIFKGLSIWQRVELCCDSQPPIKARTDIFGVTNPVNGGSSGTCMFNVPASELPGMGELTIQVTILPVALQISFWTGSTLLGIYAGSGGGVAGTVGGGKCKFENGTCQA